jgi:hypothetical protein
MIFIAVTSYRGERFQVPTRLTTVTRQTGEYKVDLTRHPKLASGHFPHCLYIKWALFLKKQNRMKQDFRRELPRVISNHAERRLSHDFLPKFSSEYDFCYMTAKLCCHIMLCAIVVVFHVISIRL